MISKKGYIENQFGLEIEIEYVFQEETKEWFVNARNIAKMILYQNIIKLLPQDEEQKAIEVIMQNLEPYKPKDLKSTNI